MRNIYALAAAMLFSAACSVQGEREVRKPNFALPYGRNSGPVVDTTKESKRARRRRLAQERSK